MEDLYIIIDEILRLTELMNEGLKNKDIDMVLEMIEKRSPLIHDLEQIEHKVFKGSTKEKVDKLLSLDKKNKELMVNLTGEMKTMIAQMGQKKSLAKKNNNAIKRYLSDGQGSHYSEFNEKT